MASFESHKFSLLNHSYLPSYNYNNPNMLLTRRSGGLSTLMILVNTTTQVALGIFKESKNSYKFCARNLVRDPLDWKYGNYDIVKGNYYPLDRILQASFFHE